MLEFMLSLAALLFQVINLILKLGSHLRQLLIVTTLQLLKFAALLAQYLLELNNFLSRFLSKLLSPLLKFLLLALNELLEFL